MSVTGDDGRLRILRVSSDIYPEVTGGFGLHVHLMSKRQGQKDHTVTVGTYDHGESDLPRRDRLGETAGRCAVRQNFWSETFEGKSEPLYSLVNRKPPAEHQVFQ